MLYEVLERGEEEEEGGLGDRRRLPRSLIGTATMTFTMASLGVTTTSLDRISESTEKEVIESMVEEVSLLFNLDLSKNINFSRSTQDEPSAGSHHTNQYKEIVMVVGSSHAKALAEKLNEAGHTVINLAVGGWTITEENMAEVRNRMSGQLGLSPSTSTLIVMAMDNSVYFGSDRVGTRYPPLRDADGKYHIQGKMVMAEKGDVIELTKMMIPILQLTNNLQMIVISPLPRYLERPCCNDPGHITN